jgi:hypothetical protein
MAALSITSHLTVTHFAAFTTIHVLPQMTTPLLLGHLKPTTSYLLFSIRFFMVNISTADGADCLVLDVHLDAAKILKSYQ